MEETVIWEQHTVTLHRVSVLNSSSDSILSFGRDTTHRYCPEDLLPLCVCFPHLKFSPCSSARVALLHGAGQLRRQDVQQRNNSQGTQMAGNETKKDTKN